MPSHLSPRGPGRVIVPTMKKLSLAAAIVAVALVASLASGSSHREAPNLVNDPAADNTDTYAYTAKDAPGALTVVANWSPGGNPASGPNFFRFDDRARYYINIDNTGEGKADIRYLFVFKSVASRTSYRFALPDVQSFSDPKLQKQTYSIVRETLRDGRPTGEKTIADGVEVAPSNSGTRTFPDYRKVADTAIKTFGDKRFFAGQRDDAFFIDLAAAFDNLNVRQGSGNTGGGLDTQAGTNIQTITMQVPEADVTRDGKAVSGPDADNATVGVWASTERRKLQIVNSAVGSVDNKSRGSWVQVSRLGTTLFNELFMPAVLKDDFNKRRPDTDDARYKQFVLNPEVARQLNTLGGAQGVNQAGAGAAINAPTTNRDDLVTAFMTGMPGLNQIDKANPVPTDTIKLNLGTPPAQTPNRFGVIGGDNAGFPNGRRLEDDVVDIFVQLAAGYLKGNRLPLGDGVDRDDKGFLETFPYQNLPDNGFNQKPSQRIEPTHAPTAPGNNPPTGG